MRIKTFQGRSLEEVLPQIKAELGPDAVVVGQRTKVQGGVAGFFGTRVIEVTATDSMPSDELLVDLEDQLMGNEGSIPDRDTGDDDTGDDLAQRFAGAMRMGRVGGLDVTDEWDPAQDAELAQEYGRVLEHAATAGFSELDVPTVARTPLTPASLEAAFATASTAAAPTPAPTPDPEPTVADDPLSQAQELARRAHEHMQYTTSRVDQISGTYAPPRALPRTGHEGDHVRTFAASVHDTPMRDFEPQAVPSPEQAASTVDHALRTDLAMPRSSSQEIADALSHAADLIDIKAIEALKSVVAATRRAQDETENEDRSRAVLARLEADIEPVTSRLAAAGVDPDVMDALVEVTVRHRLPFGSDQDVAMLLRSVVEETIQVRSGFGSGTGVHRAAFVGPANAGKSAAIERIALRYAETGLGVGVISIVQLDESAITVVVDRTFDGTPVEVRHVATAEQAAAAMDELASCNVVLVDTPTATYLDATTFERVQSCLQAIDVDAVHVVLPLVTSTREARAIVDAFEPMGVDRLVVSRVDESRYVGEILNLCWRLQLPMTFLSEGPAPLGDVRAASSREIADRILSVDMSHA